MSKKSRIGWVEDGSMFYDDEDGVHRKREKDRTLDDFEFALLGTIGDPDRLCIPLIHPKKKDWGRYYRKKVVQVKVTIELVKKRRKK